MSYLIAFVVGGLICAIGQIFLDKTKLTPGHVMVAFVVSGAILGGLGLYKPLVKFAGAGATMPVSNFGYVIAEGVTRELKMQGAFGALTGVFELAGGVVAASIFFGFIFSALFKPKS
ncbi:MAG: stage V sporulation protein AE [Syntrophothermus sp.]